MIQGKVALVTGSSRGIGKGIALAMGKAGAKVVVNYAASAKAAEEVVAEIKAGGGEAVAMGCDVANHTAVVEMVKAIEEKFGPVSILVNNAGITRDNLLMRMSEEEWDQVLNTNLKSAYNCTKAVTRAMMKQRWGRIVNITSVSGIAGNAGQANYSAAKAGMIGFTKAVARELASRNICVNAVAPGFIESDMTAALTDEQRNGALAGIPLGRFGKVDDIAEMVLFLAKAEYITGQVLTVDGGMVI